MKICILVPSDKYLTQAGVRIRYRRIEENLRALGCQIGYMKIDSFNTQDHLKDDTYIISKCYSAHTPIVSNLITLSGKKVGLDLFDDYFSQYVDSRLTGRRSWLRSMIPMIDFIICSTPAIHGTIKEYTDKLPVHIMSDPSGPVAESSLVEAIQEKLDHAHRSRVLNIGWFGMGSNPDFPVGLSDLVAFGEELARMAGPSFRLRLDILTDLRAMNIDGLGLLRRLSVPYTLEEWSEERERAFLTRSLVSFLPVNGQNFSTAKSLNRAVSALAAGTQVFSSGYPLYEPLSPFIYRDPRKLVADIQSRSPVVRTETIPTLLELLARLSSPVTEARRLAEFLTAQVKGTDRRPAPAAALTAVIHGKDLDREVHEFAQRVGTLSVFSPFTVPDPSADIRFQFSASGSLDVYVNDRYLSLMDPDVQARVVAHRDGNYHRMPASRLAPGLPTRAAALARLDSPMGLVASYPHLMADIEKVMQSLFPGIACFLSDRTRLPVSIPKYCDSPYRERRV